MTGSSDQLYIWLDGEPGASQPDAVIDDIPGEPDLDQIARAIAEGRLGRYLPVSLQFSDRRDPAPKRIRSVDVARLLRDHSIRHRRRYEVLLECNVEPEA